MKEAVQRFWDEHPCGTGDVSGPAAGTAAFFAALDARRYGLEPFIEQHARFSEHACRRVLEIGCGAGGDLARFARGGALVTGVDLSSRSLALTRRRLEIAGLEAELAVADAEALPFVDGSFDVVYAWGVLHHTPEPTRAMLEIFRVLTAGGHICIMLYHRRSLLALQAWVRYAAAVGRPWRSVTSVLAAHVESPGTRAYTRAEAVRLLEGAGFVGIGTEVIVTPWDARIGRRRFLPAWCRAVLPRSLGWFLVVHARRDAGPG